MDLETKKKMYIGVIVVGVCVLLWALYMPSTLNVHPMDAAYGYDPRKKFYVIAFIAAGGVIGAVIDLIRHGNLKECPLCKQLVNINAVKCNHCGGSIKN